MNSKNRKLFFRKAKLKDTKLFYIWTNEIQARKYSLSGKKHISWNSYKKWFKKKLLSKNCTLFVFIKKNTEIGQVRFDKKNKTVTISYSIAKKFREKGLGKKMFRMAINKYKPKNDNVLVGKVRRANLPSVKIFESSGFISNSRGKIHYFKKVF